jgi:ABC-2 type transport system ATP-binding protein
MIEVENLTKVFGEVIAVQNVSFRVEKGEVLGFLGPNGAGKTTTMRILTGFQPATAGSVRVAGFDVSEKPIEVKRRIGYLPENVPLYTDMSVESYLDFVADVKRIPPSQKHRRIEETIERTALGEMRHRLIGKLSKGYRQRVGLAQALVHEPDVLVLDEPTEGLDPRQIIEVRELIKELAGGHTVILSSHILPEVSRICGRVVIINRGKIVATDTPQRLQESLRGAREVRVLVRGSRQAAENAAQRVPGVAATMWRVTDDGLLEGTIRSNPDSEVREALATSLVQAGLGLLELAPVGMSLEDIFLTLTTEEPEPMKEAAAV